MTFGLHNFPLFQVEFQLKCPLKIGVSENEPIFFAKRKFGVTNSVV